MLPDTVNDPNVPTVVILLCVAVVKLPDTPTTCYILKERGKDDRERTESCDRRNNKRRTRRQKRRAQQALILLLFFFIQYLA